MRKEHNGNYIYVNGKGWFVYNYKARKWIAL